jgi:hypothetical protein
MLKKRLERQKIKKKLFTKRRLIILNEVTFEETFSFQLNLMNVFVFASLGAVIIITVTTFLIAFTPLREYIPGYASSGLRKNAIDLALKSDSLSDALEKNEAYLKSVVKVLNGNLEYQKVNKDSILNSKTEVPLVDNVQKTNADSELRKLVSEEEKLSNPKPNKGKKK